MKYNIISRLLAFMALVLTCTGVQAFELEVQKVTDRVYALVGEIGPRSVENHALNNTAGFVITDEGVVLVSPGADAEGAKLIEQSIKTVTDKPIKQVVTIGAQDHHWMGSDYFKQKDIPIIALAHTVNDQKKHVSDHQQLLSKLFDKPADEIQYAWPESPIEKDKDTWTLGGVDFELLYPGGGHFPGDAVLWLPQDKVLFSGDYIFLERILGVHPFSQVKTWEQSVRTLLDLNPTWVIPGHGHAAPGKQAKEHTADYLTWLVEQVGNAVEEMEDIGDTTTRLDEASPFKFLKYHEPWNRTNINRTYLQLESGE